MNTFFVDNLVSVALLKKCPTIVRSKLVLKYLTIKVKHHDLHPHSTKKIFLPLYDTLLKCVCVCTFHNKNHIQIMLSLFLI